jgi:hypothetical protein
MDSFIDDCEISEYGSVEREGSEWEGELIRVNNALAEAIQVWDDIPTQIEMASHDVDTERRRRNKIIYQAMQAGVHISVITKITGLSRARIYQIRTKMESGEDFESIEVPHQVDVGGRSPSNEE